MTSYDSTWFGIKTHLIDSEIHDTNT